MALERLVDPVTRGDPQSPLRWTCKSTTHLAGELTRQGHPVSPSTVGRLLKAAGYSLQSNRKTKEGGDHPDRNAQFEHINATVEAFQRRGQPVISVDTNKKELVGEFKNGGREWQPCGQPEEVLVHDFMGQMPLPTYQVAATTCLSLASVRRCALTDRPIAHHGVASTETMLLREVAMSKRACRVNTVVRSSRPSVAVCPSTRSLVASVSANRRCATGSSMHGARDWTGLIGRTNRPTPARRSAHRPTSRT